MGRFREFADVSSSRHFDVRMVQRSFDRDGETCFALPAPSLQRPDLLASPPGPIAPRRRNCAVAIADGDQGRTINQMMASLLAAYVERLLDGTCGWMATYLDLDDGLLRFVPAEPHQVAAVVGLHPNALVRRVATPARWP